MEQSFQDSRQKDSNWLHLNQLSQAKNNSRNIMKILLENHSSTDSLNKLLQNQLHEWSGKDKMSSKPEEKCLEPLSDSTPSQEPQEEISASILLEMSSTDLTVLNLPIRKLRYGSNQRRKLVGQITLKHGSINEIFEKIKSNISILCLSEANGILIN